MSYLFRKLGVWSQIVYVEGHHALDRSERVVTKIPRDSLCLFFDQLHVALPKSSLLMR